MTRGLMTKRRLLLLLPLALAGVLFLLIRLAGPETVERVYSRGVYPVVARVVGAVSDLVPFSLAEVILVPLALVGLFLLGRGAFRLVRRKTTPRAALGRLGRVLLVGLPVVFLLFEVLWGLNYGRLPVEKKTGHTRQRIDEAAFEDALAGLARVASAERPEPMPEATDETLAAIADGVDLVVAELEGREIACARRPKTLILNGFFRWCGIHGITVPFTHEAHHRSDLFAFEIPFVAAHERAHLAGYGSEAEANFVGYHACLASRDPLARYSARLVILRHFLFAAGKDLREKAGGLLSDGVRADLDAISRRNREESRPFAELAMWMNDAYLKANRVEGGVRDYGRVVRLLLGAEPGTWGPMPAR